MAVHSNFVPDPKGELNPEDVNYFQQSKRRINDTYNLGLAQNTYQQNTADAQQRRSLADLTRQFGAMRNKLPYSWANRGMLNSGAYQRSLTDFATDRGRTMQAQRDSFAEQMGGLTLAQQQLESVRRNSLDDITNQEAARRAAVAAALAAARG